MKKMIFALVVSLVLPSVVFAAKPVKPPPIEDLILEEAQIREAADIILQNNINAETTARQEDDITLQGQIDDISSIVNTLPPQLYAVVKTTHLIIPYSGAYILSHCEIGDTLVGGMCKFSTDPVENHTTIVYDGPYNESGTEAWACNISNNLAISEIDFFTSAICMKNTQQ